MSAVPSVPFYLTPSVLRMPLWTARRETEVVDSHAPACPHCGGALVELRQKIECGQCHTIYETCCEGARH